SEWVAQNNARSAGLSWDGRAAAGDARTVSASLVSASPTANPLSRNERTNPARRRRVASPIASEGTRIAAVSMADAMRSRHLSQKALGHLAGKPHAVLVGLEQADHRIVNGFRLLAQIMNVEPGQRRRPVERLGDAGNLAQVLLAD